METLELQNYIDNSNHDKEEHITLSKLRLIKNTIEEKNKSSSLTSKKAPVK